MKAGARVREYRNSRSRDETQQRASCHFTSVSGAIVVVGHTVEEHRRTARQHLIALFVKFSLWRRRNVTDPTTTPKRADPSSDYHLTEHGLEVAASVVAFAPANESSGVTFPFTHLLIQSSIRYPIPSREADNALVVWDGDCLRAVVIYRLMVRLSEGSPDSANRVRSRVTIFTVGEELRHAPDCQFVGKTNGIPVHCPQKRPPTVCRRRTYGAPDRLARARTPTSSGTIL
ncbi:hypothetical protein EVAR_101204_1 [Eumeta japonica]|uniref:Uncharacterized protein n=1 Tax=Eumeta variegata TaxID=151549 RepID=A0A4C2AEI2_EUMVA|nr:hypothetical protein EVAR_101204_1 [Eumeta japonica]